MLRARRRGQAPASSAASAEARARTAQRAQAARRCDRPEIEARHAGHFGNLAIRQVLEISQDDCFTERLRNGFDRRADAIDIRLAKHFFFGRWPGIRLLVEPTTLVCAEAALMHDERDSSARSRHRSPAAVANDRKQPRSGRSAAELAEGPEGAKHGVLNDVLAEDRVASEETRQIIGAVEVRQDGLPEVVNVAGARRIATRRRTFADRKARREEEGGRCLHDLTMFTTSPCPHPLTTTEPVMCGCREQK